VNGAIGSVGLALAVTPASPSSAPGAPAPATLAFAALFAGVLAPLVVPAVALLSAASSAHASNAEPVVGEGVADATTAVHDTDGKMEKTEKTDIAEVDTRSVALGAAALGLDPALKAKLARVIVRMKEEFGRDVRVVEGVRSQERQDALFAQGRSATGPVVTWTRHSLHTAGRAADVTIDGRYDDSAGFTLLRKVAAEEGLHTLGAKDPGHLELAGNAPRHEAVGDTLPVSMVRATAVAGVARVASVAALAPVAGVARVAQVASPAAVAAVAQVASPASGVTSIDKASAFVAAQGAAGANVSVSSVFGTRSRSSKVVSENAAPLGQQDAASVDAPAPNVVATHAHGQSGARDGAASQQNGEGTADPRRGAVRARAVDGRIDTRLGEASYQRLDHGVSESADAAGAPLKSDASALTEARAARVMRLQDAPAPRMLSRLTLSLDDGAGGQDQVRIGLRGSSVGASFDMRDAGGADRIAARMGELTRALEQHGLEPQAFQVRSGATVRDADFARLSTQSTDAPRGVVHTSGTNAEQRFGAGEQARQHPSQYDDQRERAQRRQDDQRRRGTSFSLTTEAS